jgi:hypothetical protein
MFLKGGYNYFVSQLLEFVFHKQATIRSHTALISGNLFLNKLANKRPTPLLHHVSSNIVFQAMSFSQS